MSVMAPGFLRVLPKAPTLYFEYNADADSAGLYHGDFLVRMSRPYVDADNVPVGLENVLKILNEHPEFQGCFVINNHGYMGVGAGFYALCRGPYYGTEKENWRFADMPQCGFAWRPHYHVGYILTKPPRRDIPCLPWHLFVDDDRRISFDYKHIVKLADADISAKPAPALYKELVNSGADFVYMSKSGPKFKMFGDVQ